MEDQVLTILEHIVMRWLKSCKKRKVLSNMSKKYEKSTQIKKKKYVIIIIGLILLLLVGILAKYIFDHQTDVSQVTADKFYFTVDLLGDTTVN